MTLPRGARLGLLTLPLFLGTVLAQTGTPTGTGKPNSDMPLVKSLLECRGKYQETL